MNICAMVTSAALPGGRDYSRKELHKKLMNNYSEETCEKVLEFVEEYGYLDEERYAKRLAVAVFLLDKLHKPLEPRFLGVFRKNSLRRFAVYPFLEHHIRGFSYGEVKSAIEIVRENAEEDFDSPEWEE